LPEKISRSLHFDSGARPISIKSLRQKPAAIARETKLQIPAGIIVLYAGGAHGAAAKGVFRAACVDLEATVRTSRIACLSALLLLVSGSVSAHHSFAMFDRSKETTIVGVVEDFQWTNPHSWIELDVPNESGGTDKWSIELNSPNNLSRQGWKSTSVKPGDKISVIIWPLRSGEKGGLFISLTLPNGQILDEMAFRNRNKQ
jgi:hypothetical protein